MRKETDKNDTEAVSAVMHALSTTIRTARLSQGMTQQAVADRIGVTLPTYRSIEYGSTTVSSGALIAVLVILGYGEAVGGIGRHADKCSITGQMFQ